MTMSKEPYAITKKLRFPKVMYIHHKNKDMYKGISLHISRLKSRSSGKKVCNSFDWKKKEDLTKPSEQDKTESKQWNIAVAMFKESMEMSNTTWHTMDELERWKINFIQIIVRQYILVMGQQTSNPLWVPKIRWHHYMSDNANRKGWHHRSL